MIESCGKGWPRRQKERNGPVEKKRQKEGKRRGDGMVSGEKRDGGR